MLQYHRMLAFNDSWRLQKEARLDIVLYRINRTATGARRASAALVRSCQTIADSVLEYTDLGYEIMSIRGDDNQSVSIDHEKDILPQMHTALK